MYVILLNTGLTINEIPPTEMLIVDSFLLSSEKQILKLLPKN